MILRRFIYILIAIILIVATAFTLAIAFGGPGNVAPLASINDPFKDVDYSDLPTIEHYTARDGATLAYRHYLALSKDAASDKEFALENKTIGSVVLVHGSSASSHSMHVLAKQFAAQGFSVYALDIRGHGDSGTKGTIGYIGQLEDDLTDFVRATKPASPSTLVGLSAGGGFALRFAAGENQNLFQSYLLLAPFLGQSAPTTRTDAGGWASVGIPRIIGLTILNNFGITQFNDLPVMNYALNEKAKQFLTPTYSYSLSTNFRPRPDYKDDMHRVKKPCRVIVGASDEIFYAEKFEQVIHAERPDWPVTLIPNEGHTSLVIDAMPISTIVANVAKLQNQRP